MRRSLARLLDRSVRNPRTSVMGLAKIAGGLWFMVANHATITPQMLMQPDGFLPLLAIVSGLNDALFTADAKDEMKAREVTPDTTVVVERSDR